MTREQTGVLIRGTRLTEIAREARRSLPRHRCPGVHLWTNWGEVVQNQCHTLYVVSSLGDLTETGELSHLQRCEGPEFKFLAFVDDLPVESIPEHLYRLHLRSERRVFLAQMREPDTIRSLLTRFVGGLCSSSTDGPILHAWREGDQFIVLSPSFERLHVPASSLPAKLRDADSAVRGDFQIDRYGDFVYWPQLDVHMGWEQFVQAADPMSRLRAEQKSGEFNGRYGRAIRSLREASGVRQSDIEGLDERTVRRIEQGQTRATANALARLAKAHGMDTSQYMAEVARYL